MYCSYLAWKHNKEIAQWNSNYKIVTQLRDSLESVKYGHNFSYDYVCVNCKMREMSYMYQSPDRRNSLYPREYICSAIQTVDDLKKLGKLLDENDKLKKETN